jgi:hypothetical protein
MDDKMSEQRPHFLFVCDHGIRGDHLRCDHSISCSEVDRVAFLPWCPDRPGWWASDGVDERAIGVWAMEGDNPGWDPKWLVSGWTDPDEPDLRRDAIEIRCLGLDGRCSRRPYRSDGDKLQTLLMTIATDEKFLTTFTMQADESQIVMTLEALHSARDTAKRCYGLRV